MSRLMFVKDRNGKARGGDGVHAYRTRKGGPVLWLAVYRDISGRRCRKAGFASRREAREFKDRHDFTASRSRRQSGPVLLGQLAEEWKRQKRTDDCSKAATSFVDRWVAALGAKRRLSDITAKDVQDQINRWSEEHDWSGSTRNRAASQIAAMLNHAVKMDLLPRNPLQGKIQRYREQRRERILTIEEFESIKIHCADWLRDIVDCGWYTMLRRSNILKMRRSHFADHGDHGTLRIPGFKRGGMRTKSRKSIVKVLRGPALELFRRKAKEAATPKSWLFPGPSGKGNAEGSFKRAYPEAVRAAGLPSGRGVDEVCFHTIRHSAASYSAANGTPLQVIQRQGGWRSTRMVERYSKVYDASIREADDVLSAAISGGGDVLDFPAKKAAGE